MRPKNGDFVSSLIRDCMTFVSGLVVGIALSRREMRQRPAADTPKRRPLEVIADALKRAEKERNAREE